MSQAPIVSAPTCLMWDSGALWPFACSPSKARLLHTPPSIWSACPTFPLSSPRTDTQRSGFPDFSLQPRCIPRCVIRQKVMQTKSFSSRQCHPNNRVARQLGEKIFPKRCRFDRIMCKSTQQGKYSLTHGHRQLRIL